MSALDSTVCIDCGSHVQAMGVTVLCLVLTGALVALVIFVRMAARHPGTARRWGSTSILILNHAQTLGIFTQLHLQWPPAVRQLMLTLSLSINLIHPECQLAGIGGDRLFWWYGLVVCAASVLLLLAPWVIGEVAAVHPCGPLGCLRRRSNALRSARSRTLADAAFTTSLIFSSLFMFSLGTALDLGERVLRASDLLIQVSPGRTAPPVLPPRVAMPVHEKANRRQLVVCADACFYNNNGRCDDGGPNSVDSLCPFGTDCSEYALSSQTQTLHGDVL